MKNTNPVGRPYVDHYAPKNCISCTRLFGRRTKSNGNGRNGGKQQSEGLSDEERASAGLCT